ncbi:MULTISPECIES: cation diffusion facilitator family transporter [Pacificibacter]|uniref:cation diffusion facilitator family transporter n=1 Tax=Pacificibacter TaxID=1042323 RepID=UPI001C0993EE|nr:MULTISPECIES: cation diffusion facilitator family transporter [Pacificibacter]MBU2937661.1 cation diffusion facilitator family transporter [Pacificibacter marinus]MDO6616155.1 cation diffusion facilitator family transporter [Pacificibacter sp. 1_MG-2023]
MHAHTRLNISAGLASVSVALILVLAKYWAFEHTGALSIATSLVDSALDLVMALGGLMAIFYAARPPDDEHTFGHTSAEDLAALGQSGFILLSSAVIAWSAMQRLLTPEPIEMQFETRGIAVMILSIMLTAALILWQRRVAKRTGSKVVAADSLHYVGDLVPNIGAIIALIAASTYDLHRLDSIVALGAAGMLAIGALRIGKSALDALMDRAAPLETITTIETIAANHPGLRGYHDLKTRMAGSKVFVHLHIELDGEQTLREAHDIGKALKAKICAAIPNCDVIIHKDVARDA